MSSFRPANTREREYPVQINAGRASLRGDLIIPEKAAGIVLFAHGSGSSRFSPRNQYVAQALRNDSLATLLFDLLTEREEFEDAEDAHLRFNIDLLTQRLITATDWVSAQSEIGRLPIGYFGASTGAAAALKAASDRPQVRAVVSRGGRPDLAAEALPRVSAATLLIVGGNDPVVIELNRQALQSLRSEKKLAIIPGATHLFEEPGTLEEVGRLAANWFKMYLKRDLEGD